MTPSACHEARDFNRVHQLRVRGNVGLNKFQNVCLCTTSISSNYPNICFENELRFHVNQSRLTFWTITELAVGPGRIRPPVDDKHLRVGRLRRQEVSCLEVMFLLRADLKEDESRSTLCVIPRNGTSLQVHATYSRNIHPFPYCKIIISAWDKSCCPT